MARDGSNGGAQTIAEIVAGLVASEQWRQIDDFPQYEVSSWGGVRSRGDRAVLAVPVHGYARVCLSDGVRRKNRTVHRLVAAAFLGAPPFPNAVVAHNDGDRSNNRVDNLRWASALENQSDRGRHGTRCRGSAVFGAKLREESVPAVREAIRSGRTYADIGEEFGVSASTIYLIAKNRIWRHAGGSAWEAAA